MSTIRNPVSVSETPATPTTDPSISTCRLAMPKTGTNIVSTTMPVSGQCTSSDRRSTKIATSVSMDTTTIKTTTITMITTTIKNRIAMAAEKIKATVRVMKKERRKVKATSRINTDN